MPIDWEKLGKEIDAALKRAEKRTDDKLASRVASLTRLTEEEIKDLFPTPADVDKLKKLMEIVKSDEDRNRKVVLLKTNIENVAETVVKLLEKFA
jgi:hypothetical protein